MRTVPVYDLMRTTLDIDAPILADLKRRGQAEHVPLGRLVSELLAEALKETATRRPTPATFEWVKKPMGAKVDLADRDALYEALDGASKP